MPLRFHLKARVDADAEGRLRVRVLAGQESFRIAPLVQANAWAVIDGEAGELAAGTQVKVYGPSHLIGLDLQGEPT